MYSLDTEGKCSIGPSYIVVPDSSHPHVEGKGNKMHSIDYNSTEQYQTSNALKLIISRYTLTSFEGHTESHQALVLGLVQSHVSPSALRQVERQDASPVSSQHLQD